VSDLAAESHPRAGYGYLNAARWSVAAAVLCLSAACAPASERNSNGHGTTDDAAIAPGSERANVKQRMLKYSITDMPADLTGYSSRQKRLLKALLRAAGLADEIFWRQTGAPALEDRAEVLAAYPAGHPVREFFLRQGGPWDRLDKDAPFLEGAPAKPAGAGFYPPDLTAREFEAWVDAHPKERESLLSPYTVIRRNGTRLEAVPYHEAYAELVTPMAAALREAASLADNPSLRRYLEAKAAAVLTDDYFDADTAWIKMKDEPFDIAIGPFEVYEDGLLNLKAAYEATVEIVDRAESEKLSRYKSHLAELEAALPYPDSLKPASAALTAAFTIVRDIYRGGQIRSGYQPVAANLPNDPRVHTEVGTKKTFWKNVMDARFNQIIRPISEELIAKDQRSDLDAQAFFDFVLMHELAHGLGPRFVHTSAGDVPVNQRLRELYSWIEENKADVAGLVGLGYFMDRGVLDPATRDAHLVSYLGSLFRTIRFGTAEAHGMAALVSINWYLKHGGLAFDAASGRYRIEPERIDASISSLASELLIIEATGDYARATRLKEEFGEMPPELTAALGRVSGIPIDIVPRYRNRWE